MKTPSRDSRITLRTIADVTGLSKYAVSRALSGKTGVSDATRDRVRKCADELGYVKSLPTRTKRLGLLFDDSELINSELYMQIQSGAQREAKNLGYDVKVHWTHNTEDLEHEAGDNAGLLIVGPHEAESLARAYATDIPIVRIGWLNPLEPVDLVGGTDHEAGRAVANLFLSNGHRDIVYVHGGPQFRGRMERLTGLREVVNEHTDARVFDMRWDESSTFAETFEKLLEQNINPTAFFCAHDGFAVTVMSDLLSRGYRIPKDASIVGFGDSTLAKQIRPPLTTIRVQGYNFGAAAIRLIDTRLKDGTSLSFPMRIQVPNMLIERDSVAICPPKIRIVTSKKPN